MVPSALTASPVHGTNTTHIHTHVREICVGLAGDHLTPNRSDIKVSALTTDLSEEEVPGESRTAGSNLNAECIAQRVPVRDIQLRRALSTCAHTNRKRRNKTPWKDMRC